MKPLCIVPLIAGLLVAPAAQAADRGVAHPEIPDEPGSPVREDAHVLVVAEMGPDGARAVYARRVELPLPTAKEGSWQVEVLGADGVVVHRAPLRDPGVLRGEFHGEGGAWERVEVRPATIAFSLRLPLVDGASRVRVLAPARELPAEDARATADEPDALVEAGSFPWPEVKR